MSENSGQVQISCDSCGAGYELQVSSLMNSSSALKPSIRFRCSVCGYRFRLDSEKLCNQPAAAFGLLRIDRAATAENPREFKIANDWEEVQQWIDIGELRKSDLVSVYGEPWQPLAETEQVQFFIDWEEPDAVEQAGNPEKPQTPASSLAEETTKAEEPDSETATKAENSAESADSQDSNDWDWDASVVDDAIDDDFWGGDFDPMEAEQNASSVIAPGDLFNVEVETVAESAADDNQLDNYPVQEDIASAEAVESSAESTSLDPFSEPTEAAGSEDQLEATAPEISTESEPSETTDIVVAPEFEPAFEEVNEDNLDDTIWAMFDDLPADVQELSKELSEETGMAAKESQSVGLAAPSSTPRQSEFSSTLAEAELAYSEVELVEEESAEMMLDNFDIDVSVDVSLNDPDIGEAEVFVSGLMEEEQSDFPTTEKPDLIKPTRRLSFHDYKGRDVGEWKAEQERLARRNKNFLWASLFLVTSAVIYTLYFGSEEPFGPTSGLTTNSGNSTDAAALTDADLPVADDGDGVEGEKKEADASTETDQAASEQSTTEEAVAQQPSDAASTQQSSQEDNTAGDNQDDDSKEVDVENQNNGSKISKISEPAPGPAPSFRNVSIDSTLSSTNLNRNGWQAINSNNPDSAIAYFKAVLNREPKHSFALAGLASAYELRNQLDLAGRGFCEAANEIEEFKGRQYWLARAEQVGTFCP